MKLLQELVIPHYPLRCEVSRKQRPKYWKPHHKNRPKKYQHFTNVVDGYLADDEGNKLIKNPGSVGRPKYISFTANTFNTGLHPNVRSILVHRLQEHYMHFVPNLSPFTKFPLIVEWELYSPVDRQFDMSGFSPYYKYFEDCLFITEWKGRKITPIIPDDDRRYITKPGSPLLCPVDDIEDRKFVFKFYHDDRPQIQNHPLWSSNQTPQNK